MLVLFVTLGGYFLPYLLIPQSPVYLAALAFGAWNAYRLHTGDWPLTVARYFFYSSLALYPCSIAESIRMVWPYVDLAFVRELIGQNDRWLMCAALPGLILLSVKKRRPSFIYDIIYSGGHLTLEDVIAGRARRQEAPASMNED